MARTMAEPDELNPYPMHSPAHPQPHPENPAYLGREQSLKYRDLGPYANATTTPTSTTARVQLSNQSPMQARDQKYPPDSPMAPSWADQDVQLDHDRDDTHYTSSSAATTPFTSFNRTSDSTAITSLSTLDESPPPSQLPSPRWDSLGHQQFHTPADHDHFVHSLDYENSNYATEQPRPEYRRSDSLTSEARDEFPPLQSPKASIYDSRYPTMEPTSPRSVSNFSRPRNASNNLLYEDARVHYPNQSRTEPPRPDNSLNHTASNASWPRDRGQSISSAQSSATFASLPVRPSIDFHGDGFRNRNRPQNRASRSPNAYRVDGGGPPYIRDPIPRMASLPTEELRASYRRSQRSASTAQGTVATERSSVATKKSSTTSYEYSYEILDPDIYADENGEDDDGYSLDDIMGMYEKGFDDSEPENNDDDNIPDNDSRPATAGSEIRRRTIVLEAMTSPPPIAAAVADLPRPGIPGVEHLIRDSASMFRSSGIPAGPLSENPVFSAEPDSGELANDDSDSEFEMRQPTRQMTDMTLTMDADRDRYGFRKQNQYVTREQYDAWNEGYTEYLERRRKKWTAYLKENGLITDGPYRFPPRSAKTKRFVRKGIPPEWRGAAWFYYAGGPAILSKHAGVYDELLKREAKEVDLEAIERDLHRTFPDNIKFRTAQSPWTKPARESIQSMINAHREAQKDEPKDGRRPETAMISALRRVLHAFAVYNPRIGYCQSLNFLAGLLLLFVETEEYAFWLLNIITRVYLPGTHEVSLEGANVDLGVLMSALRESMPAVWTKIGGELDGTDAVRPSRSKRSRIKQAEPTRLPPITLCMTAWFMSCFIGTLPIESTLRVWDIFFYEGSKTLFRIAMTVFKLGEAEIKAVADPMEIFQVVQTIPRRLLDANALIDACFKRRNGFGHISQETVDNKRQERRFQVKAEKERVSHGENAAVPEFEGKRKGSLWSRRREVRPHPAEVM
ncbi:hypothetical protein SLS62_011140 [Diatrype stigma]|uniref:Rab-GAP TBC domain-containing protein n=1 Tax=Diatrype stigma TaxID=117547 RepID=A0AAN9YEH2_9PEZI